MRSITPEEVALAFEVDDPAVLRGRVDCVTCGSELEVDGDFKARMCAPCIFALMDADEDA